MAMTALVTIFDSNEKYDGPDHNEKYDGSDRNEKYDGPDHIVFQGTMHDASFSKFSDYEVGSFDLTEEGLTLNIDTSEE